jgi:hypothetical protein
MGFNLDDYEPVASRIARFWAEHPCGAIHTELVFDDGNRCVVKATVHFDSTQPPVSSDYAEELHSDRGVNATSRIENCSTSAQGRALAACGFLPSDWTKKPSREEMSKVQRTAPQPRPQSTMASANGVTIKGVQHGDLPDWLVLEAFQAGVTQVWDNRDKVAGTKRPWFKDVNGDKAFWPPRGTPDPVVTVQADDYADDGLEEPF